MKAFSLEEYLKNPSKKVVTRDGKDVRIICTDRAVEDYPIIALVKVNDVEWCESFTIDGWNSKVHQESYLDLFFADEVPYFQPYEKVLTRGHSGLPWKANLFSNFKTVGDNTIAVCLKGDYVLSDIIPFDENKVGKIGG